MQATIYPITEFKAIMLHGTNTKSLGTNPSAHVQLIPEIPTYGFYSKQTSLMPNKDEETHYQSQMGTEDVTEAEITGQLNN